jgi:hypothetical protein
LGDENVGLQRVVIEMEIEMKLFNTAPFCGF